jgi:hypothetical protein
MGVTDATLRLTRSQGATHETSHRYRTALTRPGLALAGFVKDFLLTVAARPGDELTNGAAR